MQFLIDNLFLIAVALASGGMLLWPLVREQTAGPSVGTLQATQLINSRHAQVVDVRSAEEYATGAVPNSRNIPVDALATRVGELKKERPVIVVCQTGRRSAKAASVLRAAGIKDVFVLSGGVASWREAGLPLKAA